MLWFANLKISKKLFLLVSIALILLIVVGVLGISSLEKNNSSLATVYNDRVIPLRQLKVISDLYAVNIVDATHKTRNGNFNWNEGLTNIKNAREGIIKEWKNYTSTYLTDEEKQLVKQAEVLFTTANASIDRLISILEQQNSEMLVDYTLKELYQNIDPITAKISELIELQLRVANEEYNNGQSVFNTNLRNTLILIAIAVVVLIFVSLRIINMIKDPVNRLSKAAEQLAVGDINVNVSANTTDELGNLERCFGQMIENIKEQALVAEKIGDGDMSLIVKPKSDKDILSKSLSNVVNTIGNLVSETSKLTRAAINGDLSLRGDKNNFSGGYKNIIEGINNTLDAITTPIKEGSKVLSILATGDLTVRMNGDYLGDHQLIKNSINQMADSMSYAISNVTEAVEAAASSSNQISSSAEELAAGTQEQSQQTTEIASAVEEMTRTILENAKNSGRAADNSREASDNAKKGTLKIEETKTGMQKIVDSAKDTAMIISSLAKKSDQIGEITQVIDDIADQTNLLALNAAIEAARAGEQGRGFAVVADEVRKLAERTTKATKEIASTIKSIQREAKEADDSMSASGNAVEQGMRLTEEVAIVLKEIFDVNQKVSDMVTQVAAGSEEQSTAAEQISKNIEGISSVIQQSASGTEQIARAAEDLNKLTLNLQDLIGKFKLVNTFGNVPKSNLAIRQNGKIVHR